MLGLGFGSTVLGFGFGFGVYSLGSAARIVARFHSPDP